MLVLSRKSQEAVVVGGSGSLHRLVRVTVIEIRGGKVWLGFDADADVPVHRHEVWERICAESQTLKPSQRAERPKYRVPYID